MPEDFTSAAIRHFRDGVLLDENRSLPNADQLFGFATECAIKSALVGLPGCALDGALVRGYREHSDRLWDVALVQGIQRRHPGLAMVLKTLPQPFADWSTSQGYGSHDTVTAEALALHRQAARRVLGSVGLSGTRGEE